VSGDLEGFDPLTADEPLDLVAVRESDALIDAIGHGEVPDGDDALIPLLAAWAASSTWRPERVHVVLTPPEAWPPRLAPDYCVWRDRPLPVAPVVDTFVARALWMVAFLLCALTAVIWAALP